MKPPPPVTSEADRRDRLAHVFWIGGGSGAGKSTLARRLADAFGLRRCGTDETMRAHGRRTPARDCPLVQKFGSMTMDERWLNRSPQEMCRTFHFFRGECFGRIVEDLLASEPGEPVVVEGFRLLPRLVAPLLADPTRSVWLLPTPGFRRAALERRGSLGDIAGKTSDPPRALRNLLERDALFTDELRRDTGRLGLPRLEIHEEMTEDEVLQQVAAQFGLL